MNFIDAMFEHIEQSGQRKISSSVARSNKAHTALEKKNIKNRNYGVMQYHNYVCSVQSKQNRVLSRNERRSIYSKMVGSKKK